MQLMEAPQEPAWDIAATAPPPAWPTMGAIAFDDVSVVYRPGLPPAVRNVSIAVQPGERFGVCGRTGSGKSTLIGTLFRTVGLSSGAVRIDGVDVGMLGLHDLRQRLALVTQDPVLFAGRVRDSLIPDTDTGAVSVTDAEISSALAAVGLTLPAGPDTVLLERGGNLSVGERQVRWCDGCWGGV